MKKEAAYLTVYRTLKSEIRDKEYNVGDFLPSETELEQKFSVSRTTVRRAVDLLVRDGYVFVKQGRGTEVLDFSASQNLNIVTSFSETLRKRGFEVRSKSIYIDEIQANSTVAGRLNINEGAHVLRIQRLQLADEVPVAIIKNYLPKKLFPDFLERSAGLKSLYLFLEEQYDIVINCAQDKIFAKPADFTEAELLKININSPLLCISRTALSNEMPVSYDALSIRYDKYELNINISGRVQ